MEVGDALLVKLIVKNNFLLLPEIDSNTLKVLELKMFSNKHIQNRIRQNVEYDKKDVLFSNFRNNRKEEER